MEKKYIEVNELLKSFTPDYSVYSSDKPIRIDLRLIKRIITRQPIADVAEVKHGEWVTESRNGSEEVCRCSVCNELLSFFGFYKAKHCPNCGAKMDGGKIE